MKAFSPNPSPVISAAAELRPFTFNYINQVITQQKVNILIKNWQSRAGRHTQTGVSDREKATDHVLPKGLTVNMETFEYRITDEKIFCPVFFLLVAVFQERVSYYVYI